jgi:hypothetical protein
MGKQEKDVQTNYHIRFNAKNDLHMAAASLFASVKPKYRIAFLTAAVEAYRKEHPHGVDYAELDEIQKRSWRSFIPKVPILENLRRRRKENPAKPESSQAIPATGENALAIEAIDKAISHYGIE